MGTPALLVLFDTVGLGWAVKLSENPLVAKLVDLVYEFLSHNRISLGNTFDGRCGRIFSLTFLFVCFSKNNSCMNLVPQFPPR